MLRNTVEEKRGVDSALTVHAPFPGKTIRLGKPPSWGGGSKGYFPHRRSSLHGRTALYVIFQFCKGIFTDSVFYPAGILLCSFPVYTGGYKLLCKELMAFIDFFRHFLAYVGQVEKSILVHPQKTTVPQDAYCMTDTRF